MNLSNQEMETVLRCVDKVFDFRAERDRLRDILSALEAENKGLRARVAELEAQNAQLQSELDHAKARANELQAETLRLEDLAKHRGKLMEQAVDQSRDLEARVAELEARTREAEESNANALARLSAAEARIELRRRENEAVRSQLGHAENACDAMEKLVLELKARCKRLEAAGNHMLEALYTPEPPRCVCYRSFPCDDCVNYSSARDAKQKWQQAKEAKP